MKYCNGRRISVSIGLILLGVILIGCYYFELLDDFYNGMGVGLITVGILQIFRYIKYNSNEEYREKVDIETKDERNKYISNKAWAWTGYLFVMIAAVSSIVFKMMGYDELVYVASGSVCLMILLYWVCYLILRKKY